MPLGVQHSRLRDPLRQQATPQFGNFDRFSDSASGAFRCAQPKAAMDGWIGAGWLGRVFGRFRRAGLPWR
jgi:hypothetical protein